MIWIGMERIPLFRLIGEIVHTYRIRRGWLACGHLLRVYFR